MALINCPECNKEISDKVKACPHCGYPFIENTESATKEPQQVEITSVNLKKMNPYKKKKIAISLICLVVIFIGVFGFISVDRSKKEKAYTDNLSLVSLAMLNGASEAESLCNLTGKVWYNTIYKEHDSETDMYTMFTKYTFESDFNTSLAKLFADSSIIEKVNKIKENQTLVQDFMKKLQNPSSSFEKPYETLMKLYSSYQGLTDLAINPSGNLKSYSENKTSKVQAFMELYKQLNTQIPEGKKD